MAEAARTWRDQRGDAAVRRHFDAHTDLYVDKYEETYRTICRERIALLRGFLDASAAGPLRVLDIGCGAGVFVDMLLREYPQAQALGLDSSAGMLRRNQAGARKNLLLGDARELPFRGGSFDLINVDTVMHHLVDFRGYRQTVEGIEAFLRSLGRMLRPGGLLIVHEIYHETYLRDHWGARAVYAASTLRLPPRVAGILKRLGLATANAGVCFLTRRQWREAFEGAGFEIQLATERPWAGHGLQRMGFRRNGDLYYTLRCAAKAKDARRAAGEPGEAPCAG